MTRILCLAFIWLLILVYAILFPYFGLGGPLMMIIEGVVCMVFTLVVFSTTVKYKWIKASNSLSFSLVFLSVVFPQDAAPMPGSQITQMARTLVTYSKLDFRNLSDTVNVLTMGRNSDFDGLSKEIYIGTLYKYQNCIPLDGSFFLYMANREQLLDTGSPLRITSTLGIGSTLKTREERILWSILNSCYKPSENCPDTISQSR